MGQKGNDLPGRGSKQHLTRFEYEIGKTNGRAHRTLVGSRGILVFACLTSPPEYLKILVWIFSHMWT